jgi:hypothetical protein
MDGVIRFEIPGLDDLKEILMATQAQIDALVTRIDKAVTDIRQDIADLKAANPSVDVSKLEASIGKLEGLDAENPAPPVP